MRDAGRTVGGVAKTDDYPNAGEDDKYEFYVIHDGLGISHFIRRPKGKPPQVRCVGCDD